MEKRENLIQEALKRYKRGGSLVRIKEYFISEEIEEPEVDNYVEETYKLYFEEKYPEFTKRNKRLFILNTALAVLTFIVFYFFLDKTSMRNYPVMTSLLGTGIMLFFSYNAFFYYNSWEKEKIYESLKYNPEQKPTYHFILFFLMAIPALIPFLILMFSYENAIEKQIQLNGIQVQAEVVNMYEQSFSRRGRTHKSYYVVAKFSDENGKPYQIQKEVTNIHQFYNGQKINIIYDKNNPQNVEFLTDASKLKKFTKSIKMEHLFELMHLEKSEQLQKLNSINEGWAEESGGAYYHQMYGQVIEIIDGTIVFAGNKQTLNLQDFAKDVQNMGFKRVNNDVKSYALGTMFKFESQSQEVVMDSKHNGIVVIKVSNKN